MPPSPQSSSHDFPYLVTLYLFLFPPLCGTPSRSLYAPLQPSASFGEQKEWNSSPHTSALHPSSCPLLLGSVDPSLLQGSKTAGEPKDEHCHWHCGDRRKSRSVPEFFFKRYRPSRVLDYVPHHRSVEAFTQGKSLNQFKLVKTNALTHLSTHVRTHARTYTHTPAIMWISTNVAWAFTCNQSILPLGHMPKLNSLAAS